MKTFADRDVASPRVVVFLGPSLPVSRARELLAADYRPPARQGDIYGLLTSGATAIVLIDGVFHGAPSIWQREILTALDEGLAVFGASSMGALRAAELHPFGMAGHGTIFEWFRTGALTGDDEVALQHADEDLGHRALSEPLVNIRATLARAEHDGLLAPAEASALVDLAKQTYYPHRSYRALLASAPVQAWPADRIHAFTDYLRRSAIDLKARDAASVLARCATTTSPDDRAPQSPTPPGHRAAQSAPPPPRPVVDLWADEFARPRLNARVLRDAGRTITWPELADAASRSPSWPAAYQRVLIRWFLADWARLHAVACPAGFVRAFEDRWLAEHQVTEPAAWARARGLTSRELATLLADRALVAWLENASPHAVVQDAAIARIDAQLAAADVHHAASVARVEAPRAAGVQDAAIARIDAQLDAASPLGATSRTLALVTAWARASGLRCPRTVRDELWTRWSVASEAARRKLARRADAPAAVVRRILDDRALATWVLAQGPHGLGRSADLFLATVLELQLTSAIADLVPWQRAS